MPEFAKGIKTEDDLNQFTRLLTKLTVETALNVELTEHLGHEKNARKNGSNARNGYSSKTVLSDDGEIEITTPRDRDGTFEPQLIKKNQTRITQMDSQILSLYAKGMTTREIVATFKEMYDADVSPTLISKANSTAVRMPSLQDILIACVDGLKGFPDAINSVYPQTHIQLCIIHMLRNSLKYVSWKDYKAVTQDLKTVYQSSTEEAALMALDQFAQTWDDKYPQISKSWRTHWENLNTFFAYPAEIRKAIYTTNAIESLNSVIRQAIKKRKVFPTDDSVRKVIYLAIDAASKKWNMRDSRLAFSHEPLYY